jgi:hypothetical protein
MEERVMRFGLLFAATTLIVFSFATESLMAQPHQAGYQNFQQRGQQVQGILDDLVRTQIQARPQAAAAAHPVSGQTRQTLQSFADEAEKLIEDLRYEERFSAYVRGLVGDAIQIKATADILLHRSSTFSAALFATEYAELDRLWRVLAHRIRQTPNMGGALLRRVDQLDQLSNTLGQSLHLGPQLQRDELLRDFISLEDHLKRLADDVRFNLGRHPRRDAILTEIRRLQDRARHLRMLVNGPYKYREIADQYGQFQATWRPLKNELRATGSQQLLLSLEQIHQTNTRLQELLWITQTTDHADIRYQADSLMQSVDAVGESISLKGLLQLPDSDQIFSSASEFYTLCRDFQESNRAQAELESMRWDFRVLDVAWNDLKDRLAPLNSPEVGPRVTVIDNSVAQLRLAIGLEPTTNYQETVQLMEMLGNLADLFQRDIHRTIGQSASYSAQFRSGALSASRTFHNSTQALRDSLRPNISEESLQQQCSQLANNWRQLQQYLSQTTPSDQTQLYNTFQTIAPAIAKLQVMNAYH